MTAATYDAVVIGGGPAGCAVALTLLGAGASVALIEQTRYTNPRWGESVGPSIRHPLDQLGLWQRFTREDHLPSLGVRSYWGTRDVAYRDYAFHPLRIGWHIDRRRFDAMLAEACAARGADLWHARAVAADEDSGRWAVRTTLGALGARLIVNASGRRASYSMPFAGRRLMSTRMIALVQAYEVATPAFAWTMIESAAEGWAYTAPLPDQRRVVMFFTDPEVARTASLPELLSALPNTRETVGSAAACGAPLVLAAGAWCRVRVAGANWLCVGEAASTVDPLSGQGLCRALTDGVAAGRASLAMLDGDPGQGDGFQRGIHGRFVSDAQASLDFYRAERRWPASPFWRRRHASRVQAAAEAVIA